MKGTRVTLSDADLARLVDSADPAVAAAARHARDRLVAVDAMPDVPPHVAQLVVDVVAEARTAGALTYRHDRIYVCPYCQQASRYEVPKRKRKPVEILVPAVDFAQRFVFVRNSVAVGACRDCVDAALPHIVEALAAVPAEVPDALAAPGRPRWRRWDRKRCTKCGWSGHKGQMGTLPALLGGRYPGKCPSCGVERKPFGPDPFERVDGFDVVEDRP